MTGFNWAYLIIIFVAAVLLDLLILRLRRQSHLILATRTRVGEAIRALGRWLAAQTRQVLTDTRMILGSGRDQFRRQWQTPIQALRASMVGGALFISVSLGVGYAHDTFVSGWQLWLWLLCVAITVMTLFPFQSPRFAISWTVVLLGLLAGIALLTRLAAIHGLPATLHADEAGTAYMTLTHLPVPSGDTLNPFRYGYNEQPALYHYLQKLSISLLGATPFGIRFPSAVAGTLAVLATYYCIHALDGRLTALMGAAVMAASSYHIHWSALALNNVWDTLWVPLMLGGYTWAWRGGSRLALLLGAMALGLAQYFYAGSRIGVLLLVFLAIRLWQRDPDPERMARQLGTFLLLATVVAAPVLIFAAANPANLLARFEQDLFWHGLAQGYGLGSFEIHVSAILDQAVRSLTGFTTLPDQTGFFGGQVPLMLGLAAPMLAGGVIWACWRREFLPVLWLGLTMFLGGFMLQATPSSSHFVVAIPALAWLIAKPLGALADAGRPVLAFLLLGVIMATDLVYYFGVYIPSGASPHLVSPFPTPP